LVSVGIHPFEDRRHTGHYGDSNVHWKGGGREQMSCFCGRDMTPWPVARHPGRPPQDWRSRRTYVKIEHTGVVVLTCSRARTTRARFSTSTWSRRCWGLSGGPRLSVRSRREPQLPCGCTSASSSTSTLRLEGGKEIVQHILHVMSVRYSSRSSTGVRPMKDNIRSQIFVSTSIVYLQCWT
jgi:hypothetical protein